MHVSLDSALGRQRRLNQVGETINSIATPAAAYSLRSLTGGDPKVVRVRRESDDNERDFTSSEVNSGALVNFVNTQTVKPLDIQALQSDGRTGDFQIASAAYSLRSLGDRQATVAATGDTVTAANGKYVVQVRRSSDDTIKSFTADEVTDGTLVAFVGSGNDGFVRTWYDQSVTDQGGGTATGNHATQTTTANQPKIVSSGSLVSNGIDFDGTNDVLETSLIPPNAATLIGVANWDTASSTQLILGARDSTNKRSYLGRNSSNVSVLGNADGTLTGGSISVGANFLLFGIHDVGKRLLSTNGTVVSNTSGAASNNTNQGYMIGALNDAGTAGSLLNGKIAEVIVYASDQEANRGAYEGNIADHYNISGVPTEDNTVNGFVETWYDQSGNDNHVTNTNTGNQPKIVSSGSLLTQGGKACINFDGTDDFLNRATYTQGALSQPNTAFAVAKLDAYTDSNRKIFDGDVNTARNMLQLNTVGNGQFAHFAGTVAATGEDADANRHLFTCLFNGTASRLRIDTTQKSTANAGTNTMNGIVIGANHDTAQNFWDGDIQEIIICDSNQTSNFTILEGNINSYYSI